MHYNANGGTFADGSSMLNEEKVLGKATTLASGGLWDDPTRKPLTYNYEITIKFQLILVINLQDGMEMILSCV